MICDCLQIRRSDIAREVADGVRTLEDLYKRTGVGCFCRKCVMAAADCLDELVAEQDAGPTA